MQRPFAPKAGASTLRLAVTTGGQNILLGTAAPNDVVRIYNAGSAIAYGNLSYGGAVAAVVPTAGSTGGSQPFGSGITEVQAVGGAGGTVYLNAITSASTADLYATLGDGI